MSAPDGYQRLYLPTGKKAHLVPVLASPNSLTSSRCGVYPFWTGSWHGTGSWNENQRLERMANCRTCARLVERDERRAAEARARRRG